MADNCKTWLNEQAVINWLNEFGKPWAVPIKLLMGQFIDQLVRVGRLNGQLAGLICQQTGRQT
jgi:hypothetical protein